MQELINITALLNTMKRLWWVPLVSFVLAGGGAYELCRRLPKIYQASTLILVEPQKIPANYVKPIVTTTIDNRIRTIQQQVTSRSRIEAVINNLNLFKEVRDTVPMEDLVARVNNGIRLEVRGTSTFKIYYEDQDPVLAANIANAVAELFINENVNARKAEAKSTTTFLQEQLKETRSELERQEGLITEFSRTHMAELPEQRDVNFRMLEGLRSRQLATTDALNKERDRKLLLEKELADLPSTGTTTVPDGVGQLEQLRRRLIELRGQYTDQHPEVVSLKRQIAQLEQELSTKSVGETPDPNIRPSVMMSAREQQLRAQIADVDIKIKDLSRDGERIKQDIVDYEARVAHAPKNEQTLLALKRDYDILQRSYLELLSNKTEAEMALNLEQERQGEQFIVLDRAVPPVRPSRPNVGQLMAVGCLLGLIAGVGVAILFDITRPKFHSEEELFASHGIPVLASIPFIEPAGEETSSAWKLKLLVGTSLLAFLLAVVALFGLLRGL